MLFWQIRHTHEHILPLVYIFYILHSRHWDRSEFTALWVELCPKYQQQQQQQKKNQSNSIRAESQMTLWQYLYCMSKINEVYGMKTDECNLKLQEVFLGQIHRQANPQDCNSAMQRVNLKQRLFVKSHDK